MRALDPDQVTLDDLAGPDAAAVLAGLRRTAPLTRLPAIDGWLVTGHATAVAVMRDDRTFTVDDPRFSTARVVGPSMLSLDGAAHRRHRAPFVEPFRPKRVEQRFDRQVTTLAADLVAAVRPHGRGDLRAAVAGPLSVAVVAGVLGLPPADATTVLRWYATIVRAVSDITAGLRPRPDVTVGDDRAARARHRCTEQQRVPARRGGREPRVGRDRRERRGDDVRRHRDHRGHDRQRARAPARPRRRAGGGVADPDLDAAVVEESLRLEPAAAVVDRYATADVVVAGRRIRRGDLVRVSIAGANRDPAVFTDPDRFDPTRTDLRSQLAFARGPHVCIAMDLARLEARRAVRAVLDGLPGLAPDGDVPRPQGLVFRKPDGVPTRWPTDG